jgi:Holin of 3TMs, for gene-transfer release
VADLTGLGAVAGLATTVIEKIWPNKTEQEKAELAAALALVQGQLEVNRAEAASSSVFVAGWRPFVGWVCGAACAWNWIGLPVTKMGLALAGWPALDLSPADLTEMLPVLMGMLGLGALRTAEKFKGVAR